LVGEKPILHNRSSFPNFLAKVLEIKSFIKPSAVQDVRDALGQYVMYRAYLTKIEPDRKLYLATSTRAYRAIFGLQAVQFLVQQFAISTIVVDLELKEVVAWND
jgi:hypothetical protein